MSAPANLIRIGPAEYELPRGTREGMRVPARIFGCEKLVAEMDDQVFVQAANVATLPGIVGASLAMPDAHWGYGFPIGGVAAIDPAVGVISPGGIGFDINCGMRLVRTELVWSEVEPRLAELVDAPGRAGAGGRRLARLRAPRARRVRRGAASRARAGPCAAASAARGTSSTPRRAAASTAR